MTSNIDIPVWGGHDRQCSNSGGGTTGQCSKIVMPTWYIPSVDIVTPKGQSVYEFLKNTADIEKTDNFWRVGFPKGISTVTFYNKSAGTERSLPYVVPNSDVYGGLAIFVNQLRGGISRHDNMAITATLIEDALNYGFETIEASANSSDGEILNNISPGATMNGIGAFPIYKASTCCLHDHHLFSAEIPLDSKYAEEIQKVIDYAAEECRKASNETWIPAYKLTSAFSSTSALLRVGADDGKWGASIEIGAPALVKSLTYKRINPENTLQIVIAVTDPLLTVEEVIEAGATNEILKIPEDRANPFHDIYIEYY